MLFTRLLSIILRTAQWVFAAIVLGLSAYFTYRRSRYGEGPLGRLIFTLIWSSLSILFAVIWAIPTSSSITGYTSDLIFTAGWAAVFGILISWFNNNNCGSAWAWGGVSFSRGNTCGQWQAAQAFSFLSMCLWLATAILGIITVHRLSRRASAKGGSRV